MARKQHRPKTDPYTAGIRSYRRGAALDPEFGLKYKGWGTISAQCLYENGRLTAAKIAAAANPRKPKAKR
jgi:hypothetical protein